MMVIVATSTANAVVVQEKKLADDIKFAVYQIHRFGDAQKTFGCS